KSVSSLLEVGTISRCHSCRRNEELTQAFWSQEPQKGCFTLVTTWWKHGVIYQVYPRSFLDTTSDGTGDLDAIILGLDYLVWLGVDTVWLSPIYPSPMADFGYDITNYCDIAPDYGDLACFIRLLREARRRSIKVILDLVPNHTSDRHPWFIDSSASR